MIPISLIYLFITRPDLSLPAGMPSACSKLPIRSCLLVIIIIVISIQGRAGREFVKEFSGIPFKLVPKLWRISPTQQQRRALSEFSMCLETNLIHHHHSPQTPRRLHTAPTAVYYCAIGLGTLAQFRISFYNLWVLHVLHVAVSCRHQWQRRRRRRCTTI